MHPNVFAKKQQTIQLVIYTYPTIILLKWVIYKNDFDARMLD